MIKPIKICENTECATEIKTYKSDKRKYCSDQCRRRNNFLKTKVLNQDHDEWLRKYKDQLNLVRLIVKRGKNKIRMTTLEDLNFDVGILQTPEDVFAPKYRIGEYVIQRDSLDHKFCKIKRVIKIKNN